MVEEIKNLRIEIDGLSQLVKELNLPITLDLSTVPVDMTAEKWLENYNKGLQIYRTEQKPLPYNVDNKLYKCYDSLLLAKAWLGKCLSEIGETTPYTNDGKRKEVKDIEPTQDVNQDIHGYNLNVVHFEDKNYIEKVDWLRQEIQSIIEEVSKWYTHTQTPSREFSIARTNSYNHLCEARFWLGFELGKIRDKANNKKNE